MSSWIQEYSEMGAFKCTVNFLAHSYLIKQTVRVRVKDSTDNPSWQSKSRRIPANG